MTIALVVPSPSTGVLVDDTHNPLGGQGDVLTGDDCSSWGHPATEEEMPVILGDVAAVHMGFGNPNFCSVVATLADGQFGLGLNDAHGWMIFSMKEPMMRPARKAAMQSVRISKSNVTESPL